MEPVSGARGASEVKRVITGDYFPLGDSLALAVPVTHGRHRVACAI